MELAKAQSARAVPDQYRDRCREHQQREKKAAEISQETCCCLHLSPNRIAKPEIGEHPEAASHQAEQSKPDRRISAASSPPSACFSRSIALKARGARDRRDWSRIGDCAVDNPGTWGTAYTLQPTGGWFESLYHSACSSNVRVRSSYSTSWQKIIRRRSVASAQDPGDLRRVFLEVREIFRIGNLRQLLIRKKLN